MNQTTKSITAVDASAAPFGCWETTRLGRSQVQGTAGPMPIVMIHEDFKHALQVPSVPDQHPVQTLGANCADESPRYPIRLRRTKWRANDLDAVRAPLGN